MYESGDDVRIVNFTFLPFHSLAREIWKVIKIKATPIPTLDPSLGLKLTRGLGNLMCLARFSSVT